jgi:hypothetical protein
LRRYILASLAYDDGRTDVHLLSDEFVTHSAQEMVAGAYTRPLFSST